MNVILYRVFFLGFHFFLLRFSLLFQKNKKEKQERKYESEYNGRQLSYESRTAPVNQSTTKTRI